jgi:MFS family permease
MMVGPLIGVWCITRYGWTGGIHAALLGAIALGVVTTIFQWFMTEPAAGPVGKAGTDSVGFVGVVRAFNPTLRELLVSDILIRFCERIPYAFVILWAMDRGGVSAQEFSWLVAIEMVTAMACYIPVARWADTHGKRPFVLATFVFFTLFPLSLIRAHSFGWLALAFAVRGLKEFGEPARKALIIAQAPAELRARTYGAYYLIRDCTVTAGSFLGACLWSISPETNFVGAALCGAAGTVWYFSRAASPQALRTR